MMYYQEKLVEEPEDTPHEDSDNDVEKNIPSTPTKTNIHEDINKGKDKDKDERKDVLIRLKYASILCGIFLAIEVIGGILSGSLSILSDAAHLFADLASFIIAILASRLAARPPSEVYTYGYKRVEALAALFSVGSLALVSIFLFGEAVARLWLLWTVHNIDGAEVEKVDGKMMSTIAFIGVIVNILLAIILGEDHVHLPGMTHGHDHEHEHEHEHDHKHHHQDKCSHSVKHDHNEHGHKHHNNDKDEHDDDHDHKDDHDHDHSHVHGEDCSECGPSHHVLTAEDVGDSPLPDWKKKALAQKLDPTVAPFGGSWNMESIVNVNHSSSNKGNHRDDDSHSHKHEHDHDHEEKHKNEHDHGHKENHEHDHGHKEKHEHDHGHRGKRDHDHGHRGKHEHDHSHKEKHEHDHSHKEKRELDHGHRGKHEHDHGHKEKHEHDHDHDHQNDETTGLLSSKNHTSYTSGHDHHDHHPVKNINLSAAYIHVLGDLATSVAVLIAGIIIWVHPNLQAIDPICTLLFCIWVFKSTLGVIKSSMSILMEEIPSHLNFDTIFAALSAVKGVCDVHDLHVWSISHGVSAVSAHVLMTNDDGSFDTRKVLKDIHNVCISKFGIFHSTIQVQVVDESGKDCITCKDGPMMH